MFQEPRMYSPARQPASGFKVRYAPASGLKVRYAVASRRRVLRRAVGS
jgi:hypothetical protein